MTKKSKLIIILLAVISVCLLTKVLFYYTGPVYGIVVDANTGKPIEGAIISIFWVKGSPMGGGWDFNVETVTNKLGSYHFHGRLLLRRLWFLEVIGNEQFLAYKEGYAAYGAEGPNGSVAGSFIGNVQTYTRKNNVIKLYRLTSDDPELHEKNVNLSCNLNAYGPLMEKAVESERKKANKK
jgi:hypothetical protein